jgi:hypothetical protein
MLNKRDGGEVVGRTRAGRSGACSYSSSQCRANSKLVSEAGYRFIGLDKTKLEAVSSIGVSFCCEEESAGL